MLLQAHDLDEGAVGTVDTNMVSLLHGTAGMSAAAAAAALDLGDKADQVLASFKVCLPLCAPLSA